MSGIIAGIVGSSVALAEPVARISVAGDLTYNVYSQSLTSNSQNYNGTGSLGYGGGLLAEFGIPGGPGIETGAIFFLRKVNVDVAAGPLGNFVFPVGNQYQIHIPLLLRFGVGSLISIAGGGFYEIPTDNSSRNKNVGLEAGLRVGIPTGMSSQLFVDARYAHGLTDQIGGFKTNDIHLLIGLELGGI